MAEPPPEKYEKRKDAYPFDVAVDPLPDIALPTPDDRARR
jgi:hypothetical protein